MVEIMNLIESLLWITWITCTAFLMYRYFRTIKIYHKIIDNYDKKIEKLYILTDLLGNGACNPMVREIYDRLRDMEPEKALETLKNKGEFLRKIASEKYLRARKQMEEIIKKTDDPETLKHFKGAIEEMDGMFNLLGSIDKNSAPEHVQQIMANVASSVNKLREDGIDISIEGLEE